MEGPSARIVATAHSVSESVDALGRRIMVRRMTALDRLRLYKAAGPALATNPGWMGLASLAFSVTAIDDVPVPAPATEAQIETVVAHLGDAGIAAVSATLAAGQTGQPAADAKN